MNKVELIKGIEATITGLEAIKIALSEDTAVETPAKTKSVARREKAQEEEPVMNPPVEETEGSAEITGKFSVEQLNSMKYNEFKKLASSLGVKCTGTRDEIMERILALNVAVTPEGAEVEEAVEEEKEEKPVKSGKPSRSKKLGKKEADEPAKDEFDEQAEEIAKDTPVEDIIGALADVDIKATKKNAVVKLAQALREGLIELDDEDEEDEEVDVEADAEVEESESTAESDGDEDIEAESYFPQFDPKGYNDPDKMSEERAEAILEKMDEILTDISEDTLTIEDITSYIEDNATQDEIDLLGEDYEDEDLIKMYMELIKRTIDNDGEEHEPSDPYEVGDKDLCCGHELKYVKKTKKYVCEQCGTEYEAE